MLDAPRLIDHFRFEALRPCGVHCPASGFSMESFGLEWLQYGGDLNVRSAPGFIVQTHEGPDAVYTAAGLPIVDIFTKTPQALQDLDRPMKALILGNHVQYNWREFQDWKGKVEQYLAEANQKGYGESPVAQHMFTTTSQYRMTLLGESRVLRRMFTTTSPFMCRITSPQDRSSIRKDGLSPTDGPVGKCIYLTDTRERAKELHMDASVVDVREACKRGLLKQVFFADSTFSFVIRCAEQEHYPITKMFEIEIVR